MVIVRTHGGTPQVLMGQRPKKDRFMPDVFVFPGGRVDPEDAQINVAAGLRPRETRRIGVGLSAQRTQKLAVAAVRETYEETGLLFGERISGEFRPSLKGLEYIARAITPTQSRIRYHARFFMARGEEAQGRLRSNGELLGLRWMSFPQAAALPLVDVTRFVLEEAEYRLSGGRFRGIPLICYRRGAIQLRYQQDPK
jgi:8-oxo-dGTP pyrophosphatase MutT (NUDIX family)